MKLFNAFRSRSPSRDADTDRQRFERLSTMLTSVRDEVEREQEGLRRRYEESRRDAGMALEALDERPLSAKLAASVDQHSDTILKCEKRLQTLEAQKQHLALIGDLLSELAGSRPSDAPASVLR